MYNSDVDSISMTQKANYFNKELAQSMNTTRASIKVDRCSCDKILQNRQCFNPRILSSDEGLKIKTGQTIFLVQMKIVHYCNHHVEINVYHF